MNEAVRLVLQAMLFPAPWTVRRRLLQSLFGYRIDPAARIGLAFVVARELEMAPHAGIGHLTMIRGLDGVRMARHARIGPLNWIYAIPRGLGFFDDVERRAELVLDEAATITGRHVVDCSATVRLERLALVAGVRSQILTHSVRLRAGVQGVRPVRIGEGALVGTGSIVLGGSVLPEFSALLAGSTLRDAHTEPYRLYAGVPAREVAELPRDAAFFRRAPVSATRTSWLRVRWRGRVAE